MEDRNSEIEGSREGFVKSVRGKLHALSGAAMMGSHTLFFDSKEYPPKMNLISTNWGFIDGVPFGMIFPAIQDLSELKKSKKISDEEYGSKKSELDSLKEKFQGNLQNRLSRMAGTVEGFIPVKEKMTESGGRFAYSEEELDQIFRTESAKHNARVIDFLLDQEITKWWISASDEDFDKFLSSVTQNEIPGCLTSNEEMVRLWDWHREEQAYEWNRMLFMAGRGLPDLSGQHSETGELKEPARYTFLDLYSKESDLDKAFGELKKLYPSENSPKV